MIIHPKKVNMKSILRIFPLVILGVILILSGSCKKKSSGDSGSSCSAVSNTAALTVDGFERPVGIAFSPAQKVAVSEYRGMDIFGNDAGYGQAAPVMIFLNTTNFYSNTPDVTIPGVIAPEAVAFDANENLYITETEATAGISIYKPPYAALFRTLQNGYIIQGALPSTDPEICTWPMTAEAGL
jgi:hypothetical protein